MMLGACVDKEEVGQRKRCQQRMTLREGLQEVGGDLEMAVLWDPNG